MDKSLFFQVALIGLRLRNRHGIPRDVFTQLVWKWIPSAPPIEEAPFTEVVIDDDDPDYIQVAVAGLYTYWTTSRSIVTLSTSTAGDDDFIPNACCFCEIQLEYEDIHFVHNAAEEEPVHYEVCPECYHKAPLMGYNRDQFE